MVGITGIKNDKGSLRQLMRLAVLPSAMYTRKTKKRYELSQIRL